MTETKARRAARRATRSERAQRIMAGYQATHISAELAADCLLAMGYRESDVAMMLIAASDARERQQSR